MQFGELKNAKKHNYSALCNSESSKGQNCIYLQCFLQQTTNGHPRDHQRTTRSGLGAQATMDSIWIQYGINMDSICNQYGFNTASIWIQMEDPESEPRSNS